MDSPDCRQEKHDSHSSSGSLPNFVSAFYFYNHSYIFQVEVQSQLTIVSVYQIMTGYGIWTLSYIVVGQGINTASVFFFFFKVPNIFLYAVILGPLNKTI